MMTLLHGLNFINLGGCVRVDVGAERLKMIFDTALRITYSMLKFDDGQGGRCFVFQRCDGVSNNLTCRTIVILSSSLAAGGDDPDRLLA
jgi:hypothetical protein